MKPFHRAAGVLALELRPGTSLSQTQLEHAEAEQLASQIAIDLAALLPGAEALDLTLAAAAFDSAQILRPNWPVHAALSELWARAPGEPGGRWLVFTAHGQRMAVPALEPESSLGQGALCLLPWLLAGPSERIGPIRTQMEHCLLDQGMASAATALAVQEAFGSPLEHVRYLTLHDLCAIISSQYNYLALGPLWLLIETALLAPAGEQFIASQGPPALYAQGRVALGRFSLSAWRQFSAQDVPGQNLAKSFDYWQARERQYRALLEAHGLPVIEVIISDARHAKQALRAALAESTA